jgi:hypothetical protein
MGSVRSAAHVLDLQGYAKGLEFTFEISPVVRPDFGGISKNLKNFFSYSIRDGFAALVFDKGQYTKLAETTNGT